MVTVFKRKTFEKIYTTKEEKRFSISNGEYNNYLTRCEEEKEISDDILYTSILSNSFRVGEKVYLEEIDEVTTIKEIIKTTKGDTVYYVEDKLIETENTLQSKQLAELQIANRDLQKEISYLRNMFEDYKREYKYKHRFFNI